MYSIGLREIQQEAIGLRQLQQESIGLRQLQQGSKIRSRRKTPGRRAQRNRPDRSNGPLAKIDPKWSVSTLRSSPSVQILKAYILVMEIWSRLCHSGPLTQIDPKWSASTLRSRPARPRKSCRAGEKLPMVLRTFKRRRALGRSFRGRCQRGPLGGYPAKPHQRRPTQHPSQRCRALARRPWRSSWLRLSLSWPLASTQSPMTLSRGESSRRSRARPLASMPRACGQTVDARTLATMLCFSTRRSPNSGSASGCWSDESGAYEGKLAGGGLSPRVGQ